MERGDGGDVSSVSVLQMADGLPNDDEDDEVEADPEADGSASFVASATHPEHAECDSEPNRSHHEHDQQVQFVTPEQLQLEAIRTAHIVIHDHQGADGSHGSSSVGVNKMPTDALSSCIHNPVLPVRCKTTSGQLHKAKFGSGGRGRCIKVDDKWYTPNEFEGLCGRASSKDWKRSIRYGGRTLQCLIEEGVLRPHATSCTCAACCDDVSVVGSHIIPSGPVRLFVPYKRKKKDNEPRLTLNTKKLQRDSCKNSLSPQLKDMVVTLASTPISMGTPTFSMGTESLQVVTSGEGNLVVGTPVHNDATSVMVTSMPQTPKPTPTPTVMDFNEQKQWWQLEEMVNTIVNYGQQLKQLLEQVKNQTMVYRELQLQQLRTQLENEKKEALNAARMEAQVNLHRAIVEERNEKEIAMQQAVHQVRAELQHHEKISRASCGKENHLRCANCNREAFSECTGCHRVSYCSQFCQRKDWANHSQECDVAIMSTNDVQGSSKDK